MISVRRQPSSRTKDLASRPKIPNDSTATGTTLVADLEVGVLGLGLIIAAAVTSQIGSREYFHREKCVC